MFRALSAPRAAGTSSARGAVRVVRRRFATETPVAVPKKKKNYVRRIVIYSTLGIATFYAGSAFVSLKSSPYYDFFVTNVPLGAAAVQYADDNDWDSLTPDKFVEWGMSAFESVYLLVVGENKSAPETRAAIEQAKEKSKEVVDKTKDKARDTGAKAKDTTAKAQAAAAETAESTKSAAGNLIHRAEEKVKEVAGQVFPKVERNESSIYNKGAKAAHVAQHQAAQFSEGVEDLVRRAEAALGGKPINSLPDATTSTAQPSIIPSHRAPSVDNAESQPANVYSAPLPVGFEPPPGFARPALKKVAPASQPTKEEPKPEPLPLVAPAVAEFSSQEPYIAQLASVIDNLASFVNTNPVAANKARDILDTAQTDLKGLASRLEEVKEEERNALEARLDEQTREYTTKLLELEMEAQDKLDNQEQDFRQYFEQEKVKFVQAYRAKLEHELQTQSELINERLKEEVIAQGIEMQRRWIREIKVRVEQERGGRLAKLDELATNLKKLERIAVDNSVYLDENIRVHSLWSALRALNSTVDAPVRQPFRGELRVLRHIAAAREDLVVSTVLETLEKSDVPDVGVEPFADLATWFSSSVRPKVSSVALVPDENAGLLSHLASHFFSAFQFPRHGLVPGNDVLSVLARADHYLNEKDLNSAACELNQLQGTAKVLLTDWLDAARKRLEVLQALEIVQAQATLASLLVAQD